MQTSKLILGRGGYLVANLLEFQNVVRPFFRKIAINRTLQLSRKVMYQF